ncbi:MAG TPA: OmpA family protein [Eudoraea sp.]|nr:OmpA family protein [Eudoraea sp.]
MTKSTTNLLGIIITILAGAYFFVKYCSECRDGNVSVKDEIVTPPVPKPTSYPFTVSDGDFNLHTADNFNFKVSSATFLEPLSQQVRDSIVPGLKNFLTENENKVLNITGLYRQDDVNNTAFPDLGLARANDVKNYFVSRGIPSAQINTGGKIMPEMVPNGDVFLGPVEYSIEVTAVDIEAEMKVLHERITTDPLVLYFETAEATISLTEEQRQKFAEISRYLDKVENARCEITGYTDNEGGPETNIKLGQERADFAKAYIMSNGIPASKIKAESKGSADPVASNETEEGRAKNRRTVITIKNQP